MKKISIITILLAFLCFLWMETSEKSSFNVLEIISPTQIVVDINDNGQKDDGEEILLQGVQSFSTKLNSNYQETAKKLKISSEDAMGLGFLAENFAKEKLLEKQVKLVQDKEKYPHNDLYAKCCHDLKSRLGLLTQQRAVEGALHLNRYNIFVDNQNYETLLLNSGLAVKNDGKRTAELDKNIIKIQKMGLRIFNEKSHKYHKLTCKYGLLAHSAEILPSSQLPKDSKPCKFCLVKREKGNGKSGKRNGSRETGDEIPYIKSPSVVFNSCSIRIFLTDLTSVSKPSNDCNTALCRALLQEVNSSQNTIDFAIYGYTKIPKLQTALENAQKRGVKIRFVYDIDGKNQNLYPDTLYLSRIFKDNMADFSASKKSQNAIMHNKFFIFDNKKVFTGSANISNTDMSGFNSNVVVLIDSNKIANLYEQEFEQMYSGNFHSSKRKISEKEHIELGDSDFSIYFSPKDKAIAEKIIPLIDGAKNYIYMPTFLITHKALAQSLIRASKHGVSVKVIIDATNAHGNYSAHKLLRENGIQVKTENFAGKMHSKSIIIDDIYTVIGSMNFSRSGEGKNDENLIVIKNRDVAIFYKTFFQYLWKRIPDKWLKLNARAESPDSIGSCSDGIDNDFDGKIDKNDDSCKVIKTH